MLTAPRYPWPGMLAGILGGCAGSGQAVPGPPLDPAADAGQDTHVVPAADDDVRLHRHDGTVVPGAFARVERQGRDTVGPVVGVLTAVGIIHLTSRFVAGAMSLELFEESR